MTKSKGVDPAVQAVSAIQNTMVILSNRVTARGGNLTEALVRLGKGETRYENSLNMIAGELAAISAVPPTEIVAPEGGCIHEYRALSRHVLVDESIDWNAAIDAGFPDTPSNHSVRSVGNQYPSRPLVKSAEREIILVNFGIDRPNVAATLMWGKENKLIPSSPRSVWALGKHKPQLHVEFGLKVLMVASPQECLLDDSRRYTPYGWWAADRRVANLGWLDRVWVNSWWFAFERAPSA